MELVCLKIVLGFRFG